MCAYYKIHFVYITIRFEKEKERKRKDLPPAQDLRYRLPCFTQDRIVDCDNGLLFFRSITDTFDGGNSGRVD